MLRLDYAQATNIAVKAPTAHERLFGRHHVLFVQALAVQDAALFARYEALADSAEDAYDALPASAQRDALQAELHFELAILKVLQQRNWSAYWDIRQAYNLARAATKRQPTLVQPRRIIGVIEAGVASLPSNYQWVANLLGFTADMQAGLRHMQAASEGAEWLPAESALLAHYVQKRLAAEGQAPQVLAQLHAQLPDAVVVQYLLAVQHLDQRDAVAAAALLQQISPQAAAALPFVQHALAKALLFQNRPEAAVPHLERFLQQSKGRLLRQDAQYRLGISHLLTNHQVEAQAAFAAVGASAGSGFDEDKYAMRQAAQYLTKLPDTTGTRLLQARLLYDGGDEQAALAILAALPQRLPLAQAIERDYRYGRIYHSNSDTVKAEAAYRRCAAAEVASGTSWMPAFSRYYLGQLAASRKQFATARQWYQLALAYTGTEYRNGLEQQVKAAMQRLAKP